MLVIYFFPYEGLLSKLANVNSGQTEKSRYLPPITSSSPSSSPTGIIQIINNGAQYLAHYFLAFNHIKFRRNI